MITKTLHVSYPSIGCNSIYKYFSLFLVDKVVIMGGYNGENVNNVSSEVHT